MRPRVLLAKVGRRWFRQFPTKKNERFVRDHFRKWCAWDELITGTTEGFLMFVSPRDYASFRIFFFGVYDPAMTSFIKAHVPEGAVCWDVGAERGWFSLLMGRLVGPSGRVDAFEAFPPTFAKLEANIALNEFTWVHPHSIAVSDRPGRMGFVPAEKLVVSVDYLQDASGYGYLTADANPEAIEVATITLDQHAEETGIDRLDFIKMDIEGAEVAALEGARRTIRRFRPKIAIEYNRATCLRAGTSWEELDALLDSYGYDRFTFFGRLRRVQLEEWSERPDHEAVFNAYCFPRN